MERDVYQYRFSGSANLEAVDDLLGLAVLAAESIHGRTGLRMNAEFVYDEKNRRCVINAGTPVGQDIARIFTGFLTRNIGEDGFEVERVGEGA